MSNISEIEQLSVNPYRTKDYKKILVYELSSGVTQDLYAKNYCAPRYPGYGIQVSGLYIGETLVSSGASGYTTDTGFMDASGRYIDRNATLKLYMVDPSGPTIYSSASSGFESYQAVGTGDQTLDRYVQSTETCTIFVEVGPALVKSHFIETEILARNFPSWTDIYSSSGSVGQKLINVYAQDIEKAKSLALFPGAEAMLPWGATGDITRIWETKLDPETIVVGVTGDGVVLGVAEDEVEFLGDPSGYIFLPDGDKIYTTREFSALVINGVTGEQNELLVWNLYDDWAAQFGLSRIDGEDNNSLYERIYAVYSAPPGAHSSGIMNAVSRGIDIAPSSVNVYELRDSKVPWQTSSLPFQASGLQEHEKLAEWINVHAANSWDYMRADKVLWQNEDALESYGEVPYLLDQSPTSKEDGIGDLNDLYIDHLDVPSSVTYSVDLSVVGMETSGLTYYPRIDVWGELTATGINTTYVNGVNWLVTLQVNVTGDASGIYVKEYTGIIEDSQYVQTNPIIVDIPVCVESPTALCSFRKRDATGAYTEFTWANVTSAFVTNAQWDFTSNNWVWIGSTRISNYKAYSAGFERDFDVTEWSAAASGLPAYFSVKSITGTSSTGEWTSTPVPFNISCNGSYPATSTVSGSISCPLITVIPPLSSGEYTYISASGFQPIGATGNLTIDGSDTFITGLPTTSTTIQLNSESTGSLTCYVPYESRILTATGTLTEISPYRIISINPSSLSISTGIVSGARYKVTTDNKNNSAHLLSYEYDPTGTITLVVWGYAGTHPEWSVGVHGGTYYLSSGEYLLHTQEVTEAPTGAVTGYVLSNYPSFGYPLSITDVSGRTFREVHYTDASGNLSLNISETVSGNGTDKLEAAYTNIYNIKINGVSATGTDNLISTTGSTSTGSTYILSYTPCASYYVDYDYQTSGMYKPLIVFDSACSGLSISYSSNPQYLDIIKEPLVDTEIPLSPFFSHPIENFMYLSSTGTQTPTVVNILNRPPILYRNESIPVWVEVLDQDNNPIGGDVVTLATGTSPSDTYTTGATNSNGYIVIDVYVTSGDSSTGLVLCASASNGASGSITYLVDEGDTPPSTNLKLFYRSYEIADLSYPTFTVSGYLYDSAFLPIPTATINTSTLLPDLSTVTGSCTGDINGVFSYSYTPSAEGRYAMDITYGVSTIGTGFRILER
jgi:hypothetical protein